MHVSGKKKSSVQHTPAVMEKRNTPIGFALKPARSCLLNVYYHLLVYISVADDLWDNE